jgi:hypothetical protein
MTIAGRNSIKIQFYILNGKGKVSPALFSTGHHAMKAYWGMEA